jgi:hypothetical protein
MSRTITVVNETQKTQFVARNLPEAQEYRDAHEFERVWIYSDDPSSPNPRILLGRSAGTEKPDPRDFVGDREGIENLAVGDLALDPYGKLAEVVQITARDEDLEGRLFVCYYVKTGTHGGSISMSQKEGEIARTVDLTRHFKSHELDEIERQIAAEAITGHEAQ